MTSQGNSQSTLQTLLIYLPIDTSIELDAPFAGGAARLCAGAISGATSRRCAFHGSPNVAPSWPVETLNGF
eukprot:4463549-Pyramimonas_sp.AAC.1